MNCTALYQVGGERVTGVGLGLAVESLEAELGGATAALVFDETGRTEARQLLEGLAETQFAKANLEAILSEDPQPESWRVGEALAERYLSIDHNCYFPWPDSRDERKHGSSLPGADLVGFQLADGIDRFAFGEVKTSSDSDHPPGVMFGRHGLKQQMEDLRNRSEIRHDLVRYLAHRASNAAWSQRYQTAAHAYLQDTSDVRLFGILVRDVTPHEDDVRTRVDRLAGGCPGAMSIRLVALYLPSGSINDLSDKVVASRRPADSQ